MAKSQSKSARVRDGKSAGGAAGKEERTVQADLQAALGGDMCEVFAQMPPSHRKQWLVYVREAKKPSTRVARIGKVVAAMKERHAGKISSRR